MKTVAFFINDISNVGGTQKVVALLTRGFTKYSNVKIIIYSLEVKQWDCLSESFSNVEIISLASKYNVLGLLYSIIKINILNHKYKVDTIIGIGAYLSIFLPFFINVKKIASEHNSYSIVSNIMCKLRKFSYKYIDYIVSLTENDLDEYKRINDCSIVIPNPIDKKGEKLNIERTRFNSIVAVGTLTKRKGFERLLRMWLSIENRCDFSLDIYGDGEDLEKLKKQSKEYGHKRVTFHGKVSNIEEYLSKAKIFVMTSYVEGFPMVLLEAMSSGLPCIAYDIKTGPKEIIINTENGYLINDDDEVEFINAVLRLTNDDLKIKKMSLAANKSIMRFETESVINKWLEII
ncbi:TPA: glycosyltransferase [Photobacterium damselae]